MRASVEWVTEPDSFLERPAWQAEGACLGVDPDLFFPVRGASTLPAKTICRGCSVREDCLDFALESREKFGIWGGLSERERRRKRRLIRKTVARGAGVVPG